MSAGGLDLRAATALSLLARRGPVRLVAVPIVRPERAAGLPARVIEIRVRGSVATAALQQLSLPYHPTSVRQLGGVLQRWTWSIRAQPLAPR